MSNVSGVAKSGFSKADAFKREEASIINEILRECESEYQKALRKGVDVLVLCNYEEMSVTMFTEIKNSGRVVAAVKKVLPDALDVELQRSKFIDRQVGNTWYSMKVNVAVTEKGAQIMEESRKKAARNELIAKGFKRFFGLGGY